MAARGEDRRRAWQLWSTACHEAGHAVAAYDQRRRFERVSIVPEWDSLGRLLGVRHPERCVRAAADAEDFMALLLAGAAAEALCSRYRGWGGSLIDQVRANRLASRTFGEAEECRVRLHRARVGARDLVWQYRPAIDDLARALVQWREVSSSQARAIICRAMRRAEDGSSDERHEAPVFMVESDARNGADGRRLSVFQHGDDRTLLPAGLLVRAVCRGDAPHR
jgi:hypothetical protein